MKRVLYGAQQRKQAVLHWLTVAHCCWTKLAICHWKSSEAVTSIAGWDVERLGSSRTLQADVRIVAATNQDLSQAVAEQRFRADLFYRIHVITLHLPPLRQRRADIPLLVAHFLRKYTQQNAKPITLCAAGAPALAAYPGQAMCVSSRTSSNARLSWPGTDDWD